jgi:hypothetical protein
MNSATDAVNPCNALRPAIGPIYQFLLAGRQPLNDLTQALQRRSAAQLGDPCAVRAGDDIWTKRSGSQPFAQPAGQRRRDIQNPSVSWSPSAWSSTGAGTNADRPRQSRQQPSYP